MPLYEYRCLKCKRRSEKIEKVRGPHLKKCPYCGGEVESLISAPAIQFKGSGWYVTDYGRQGSGDGASKSAEAEKAEKPAAKPEAPEKDKKKPASSSKEK